MSTVSHFTSSSGFWRRKPAIRYSSMSGGAGTIVPDLVLPLIQDLTEPNFTYRFNFAIPAQIKEILEKRERQIERVARKYGKARDFLYLGRGINYPVALEGALKLKEISYIHAEGYSAGEMKHGPIALIDEEMPVVVIIPFDSVYEKTLSNLREVESRNGRIIAVTDRATAELEEVAWEIIEVPTTHRMLMPVLTTVPLQLLAYHIAVYRGTDVDQPRNLAKSVTVE